VPTVWPVLVHLRVIVYQLAVRAKHKGATRANPDDWIMKVKIFFRASRRRIGATHLYALASPYASYGPAQYRHPPFNIPRSAPAACRPRLPLTQQSQRMLHNFPPGCPPLQKKLCTALSTGCNHSTLQWYCYRRHTSHHATATRGSHIYVACRSVCDQDQEFWSVKIVLDRLIAWLYYESAVNMT